MRQNPQSSYSPEWQEEVQRVINRLLASYEIYSAEIRNQILAGYVHPKQTSYNMMVFDSIYNFLNVPVGFMTVKMLVSIVDACMKHNEPLRLLLSKIPDEISENLFRELVEVRSSVLNQLPERFITGEFVEIAMQCPLFTPHDLPSQYQSHDVWEEYLASLGIEMTDEMRSWVPNSLKRFDNVILHNGNDCPRNVRYLCTRGISNVVDMRAFWDPELVEMAVHCNVSIFHKIPPEFLTYELCMFAVAKNLGVSCVPEKFRSYEMYYEEFKYGSIVHLVDVPKEFRDFKMCQISLEKDPRNFDEIPSPLRTAPMYLTAVSNGMSINTVPKEFLTYEMCLTACKKVPVRYSEIPTDFRTLELIAVLDEKPCVSGLEDVFSENSCLEFIKTFPHRILEAPEEHKTFEVYKKLVISHKVLWCAIPKKYLTKEMYLARVCNDVQFPNLCAKYRNGVFVMGPDDTVFPEEYYCEEFFHELYIHWKSGLELWQVPVQFRTAEMCTDFFLRNPKNLKFVPMQFRTPQFYEQRKLHEAALRRQIRAWVGDYDPYHDIYYE